MIKTKPYIIWEYIYIIQLFFKQGKGKYKIKDICCFWWEGKGSNSLGTHRVSIMF